MYNLRYYRPGCFFLVRIITYVDLGLMFFMFQWRFDYSMISLLYLSARCSCIIMLEIPGCGEGVLEDRRAVLSRGKVLVALFGDCKHNERGNFLA